MIVRYDADYYPVDLTEWKQFTNVRIMIKRGPKFWKWSSIEGVIVLPFEYDHQGYQTAKYCFTSYMLSVPELESVIEKRLTYVKEGYCSTEF